MWFVTGADACTIASRNDVGSKEADYSSAVIYRRCMSSRLSTMYVGRDVDARDVGSIDMMVTANLRLCLEWRLLQDTACDDNGAENNIASLSRSIHARHGANGSEVRCGAQDASSFRANGASTDGLPSMRFNVPG